MKKNNLIWLVVILLGVTCLCCGCGQKAKEERVVARINNYAMTAEDLEDEIKYSPYAGYKKQNLEEVLDLAIRKQILIQEAQRQGLDRNQSFMKTIERYWEQTLIKELLQKETGRIYEGVSVDKQDEALNDWVERLYKKANIKIYKEVLKEMEEKR